MKRLGRSLFFKLTLAILLVALLTAALVALVIRFSGPARLNELLIDQQVSRIEEYLGAYYRLNGSWDGLPQTWRSMDAPFNRDPGMGPQGEMRPMRGRISQFGFADQNGVVIVPMEGSGPAGSPAPAPLLNRGRVVLLDGVKIGTILLPANLSELSAEEQRYLQQTNDALLLAVFAALLLSTVLGYWLARTLTRPLRALTSAAEGIARGELEQRVETGARDEIGDLAAAFNTMSSEVARVNQQRRQMTADIAHDLRTPLTVIGGYIESMRDGVLKPTPERLNLIYAEIERLQKMVNDLRMLAQADSGELSLHLERLDPRELLTRAHSLFQHTAARSGVTLEVETAEPLPFARLDENRMMQVLDNLISNALRYTPAGGTITLAAAGADSQLRLSVRDTGSGIDPADLPYIFDRFRRADKSRHADHGESGLGLAIVRTLVELQGGRVWAESTPGAGTVFTIEFPACE